MKSFPTQSPVLHLSRNPRVKNSALRSSPLGVRTALKFGRWALGVQRPLGYAEEHWGAAD